MATKRQVARVLGVDGTEAVARPADGRKFALRELQGLVGGLIEPVRAGRVLMWVNEEGLLLGMQPNAAATKMAGRPIVGPVVVMGTER